MFCLFFRLLFWVCGIAYTGWFSYLIVFGVVEFGLDICVCCILGLLLVSVVLFVLLIVLFGYYVWVVDGFG